MPTSAAAPAPDRQVVLTQCRLATERKLVVALGPLLDECAQHLAEFGAQAKEREDREQSLGAAHRLFHERADFFTGFREEFSARFDARARSLLEGGPSAEELDRETLAMLKTNVLENEVVVIKLSLLLKSHAAAELDELARRLRTLLKRPALEDGHNPIGPVAVVHAIFAGFAKLPVESRALRALRPLLEQGLTAPIRDLYTTVNQLLETLHVVPAAPAAASAALMWEPMDASSRPGRDPILESSGEPLPAVVVQPQAMPPAAEVAAARAVASALVGATLPPNVDGFLRNDMRNLLARAHARQGSTGAAWQQAIGTMLDLVWSLKPKNAGDRAKLAAMLPGLLPRVSATLGAMELDPARRKDLLDTLAREHRERLRGAP